MPHQTALRDNRPVRGSAANFLRDSITTTSDLSFVSAYFTVHAYDALRDELESARGLRFLFGEPSFVELVDSAKGESRRYSISEAGMKLENAMSQRRLARDCAAWIQEKVEIRSVVRSGFLHGKMYHIQDGNAAQALLGSSNFTVPGLGAHTTSTANNIELNIVVDSTRDRNDLLAWFDELWNDRQLVADVKEEVLRHLARLYGNQSPQFIYYLTLFHVFREFLKQNRDAELQLDKTNFFDSLVWKKLYGFQRDGVRGAIRKLLDHNGCILADSVGLGKTFEALAVIKYFEMVKGARVLVLCPKKLGDNWLKWLSPGQRNPLAGDKFNYDVLSHTDLSRARGQVGRVNLADISANYELIIIDESHNFRNNAVGSEREDGTFRQTRYERLMKDLIQPGIRSKVLLLSATPVNNQLQDLRNQISFIAGGDVGRPEEMANAAADAIFAKTLGIPSIRETCRMAQLHFTTWAKQKPEQRNTKDLLLALGGDLFKLLDSITIARSRRQIERHYKEEMESLGGFPHRVPPQSEYPHIDTEGKFPSFEEIDHIISGPPELRGTKAQQGLKLSLYHPTKYLRKDLPPETRAHYDRKIGNFNQEGRERILIAMMKVNFLKRLESSIDSFRRSLENVVAKIDDLEARMKRFEKFRDDHEGADFNLIDPALLDDGVTEPEEFKIGGRHRLRLAHMDIPEWRCEIAKDRAQITKLIDRAKPIPPKRDAKLKRLKELLTERFENPEMNKKDEPIRKVLIFSAFADTARYLHGELASWAKENFGVHTALVAGGGEYLTSLGRPEFEDILTNFSPRSKDRNTMPDMPQKEEIDLLIATDCISEGQNLQDANFLINYDIHWNPVRIIQRFGRIDRIGSRHHNVRLVNFWPTEDLDAYLKVKQRVEARMALVDLTASGEDNLLNTEQIEDLIKADLHYRNKQLLKLKDEVLDLEDFNEESVTLTDFSLDDFRLDLLAFLEANRKALEEAEPGLYAVVEPDPQIPKSQPGVIFCLRQKVLSGEPVSANSEKLNPTHPHFLVYVLDSGDVRFSFAAPKQILQIFRELAAGQATADEKLCDLFDARTKDGADMAHYAGLARKALESIRRTFARRAASSLLSSRDGLLPLASEQPAEDDSEFELLTWLVIQPPAQ